ncbi:MAG: hypothetical protein H8D78_13765 [Chloroflexi bacterium]|nr:hypothetical protein [Chloroflexota bacterium]
MPGQSGTDALAALGRPGLEKYLRVLVVISAPVLWRGEAAACPARSATPRHPLDQEIEHG